MQATSAQDSTIHGQKNAGASTLLVGVAIVVGIIAWIPKEVWGIILAVGVVVLVFWIGTKVMGAEKATAQTHRPAATAHAPTSGACMRCGGV